MTHKIFHLKTAMFASGLFTKSKLLRLIFSAFPTYSLIFNDYYSSITVKIQSK